MTSRILNDTSLNEKTVIVRCMVPPRWLDQLQLKQGITDDLVSLEGKIHLLTIMAPMIEQAAIDQFGIGVESFQLLVCIRFKPKTCQYNV